MAYIAGCDHWFDAPRDPTPPLWHDPRPAGRITRSCYLCGLRQWAVFDDDTGRYRHVYVWDAVPLEGVKGYIPAGPPKEPTP